LHILGENGVLRGPPNYFDYAVEIVQSVLHLEAGDVSIYLSPLNSLLDIDSESEKSDSEHGVFFHHNSFTDFLYSPERSKDYCIDAPKYHSRIGE